MSDKKSIYFRNPKRSVSGEDANMFIPAHKRANINQIQKNTVNKTVAVPSRFPGHPDNTANELYNSLSVSSGLPKSAFIDPNAETFSTVDNDLSDIEITENVMYPPIHSSSLNENEVVESNLNEDYNVEDILTFMEDNSYLLLIEGVAICSGPLNIIEDEVSALIYGKHSLCDGEPINPDSICVVKKMSIKVGAFLE